MYLAEGRPHIWQRRGVGTEIANEEKGEDQGMVYNVFKESLHGGYVGLDEPNGVGVDHGEVDVVPFGLCEDNGST